MRAAGRVIRQDCKRWTPTVASVEDIMSGHNIIAFVGPGVALCDRCNQELDVYEWSEPCRPTRSRRQCREKTTAGMSK